VPVGGKGRVGATPAAAKPFARYLSPPLGQLVAETNKWSNNQMAEQLLKAIGARVYGAPGSFEKGLRVLRSYVLGELRYPLEGLTVQNGSGLGDANRMPPELIARLLIAASRDALIGPEFAASLSMAGADGTLRRLFKNTDVAYHLRGKSGSLNDVFAIAGLLTTKGGRQVAVVVNLEGIKGHDRAAIRSALREIFVLLADWNGVLGA